MTTPVLLHRDQLREGLIISRRRKDCIARAIMLATGSRRFRILPDAWNHDAILVRDPGTQELRIGDALYPGCVLTPVETWERDCVKHDTKIIVLELPGAGPELETQAANWWLHNVYGRKYDKVAIWRLALKTILGDWTTGRVGLASRFYCTEGVREAYAAVIRSADTDIEDPWGKKVNPTPGTTRKRWKSGQLRDLPQVFTMEGRKYAIAP